MLPKNKLLLISANTFKVPYPVYPIGISYLTTYLKHKSKDLKIETFDSMNQNYSDLAEILKHFSPDMIGISMRNVDDVNSIFNNSFVQSIKDLIDFIRTITPAVIILGGSGFSIFPKILYDYLKPDFGIFGEGEENLRQLINCIQQNTSYENIPGLVYKSNNDTKFNNSRTHVKQIILNYNTELLDFYWLQSGMVNIQTKRGCPFKCIYCTYPLIEGNIVRCLNNDNIIETIAKLKNDKGYDYFFFTDSVFNIKTSECIDLAKKLIKKNLNIKWGAYFSPYRINVDEMELYRDSGLSHVEFGTDSLSDEILQKYHKPFFFKDVLKASEVADSLGINQAHFLILNGIGETEKTLSETFENSKKLGRVVLFPFIGMRIYPNTELEKIAISEGKINPKDDNITPVFYQSINYDLSKLKEKAKSTCKRWVFPDEDHSPAIEKMRKKGKKGPLWEYLI